MTSPETRLREALPDATVIARGPGRVNLIGEHTDYNGFPVLPMAIDRSVWVAAAPRPGSQVTIRNLDGERFATEVLPLAELATRAPRRTWTDYVVAALRIRPPRAGLELLVAGDVPVAAGLSSSSALVVAVLLALEEPGDRIVLAEAARQAERYVGTLSGGMDQAISLLGQKGHALHLQFRPLRARPVPLPAGLRVLVVDSGIAAAKGGLAQEAYNTRVRECGAAARLLGAPADGVLADVPGPDRMRRAEALGDPVLRRRARFVFAEAERVDQAERALRTGDLEQLGRLLDASHQGLRDDYEVSHPEVDRLVAAIRTAGALGARIVGAGFGGCLVAVCRATQADAVCRRFGRPVLVSAADQGAERWRLRQG
jgi:galactokinase